MKTLHVNSELDTLKPDTFTSLLDRFFNDTVNSTRLSTFTPRFDVSETANGYEFQVALPGLKEEDINVDFQEGRLTISGERKFVREENQKKYHLVETQYGSFSRSFYLPDNVAPENIEAHFENGMLLIQVPKDEKKVQKHQIKIKSGANKPLQVSGKTKSNGQTKETADA